MAYKWTRLTLTASNVNKIPAFLPPQQRWWDNFLAPIQVQQSPNFVSHTLGHRKIRWLNFGRSRSMGQVCAPLNALLVSCLFFCYLVRTLDLFHNFRCFTNTVKLRYNGLMGTPLKRSLHQKSIISKPVSLTGHRNVCLAPPTASWRSTQLTTPTPQQWSSCLLGAEDDTTTWKPMLSHRAVTGSRVFSNIINWSCRQPRCKKRMVSCMIT